VAAGISEILGRLREAAGDDVALAVMTYYDPFPGCHLAELSPLAQQVLDGDGGLPSLNGVRAAAADTHGGVIVPTRDVVGPDDLVGGDDCLHPDATGHAKIAAAFAEGVAPLLRD
jgi:lysophospholipase L1-like esterase